MGMEQQTDNVKAFSEYLRANPSAIQALASNPKSLMADFGIELDDATATALSSKLADRQGANITQAAIIHVDV